MKTFFRFFFASLIATTIAFLVAVFVFIGVISSMFTEEFKSTTTVKPNTTLVVDLNRPIVDRTTDNPFEKFAAPGISSMFANTAVGLNTILENIKKAKNDDNIKGILLRPALFSAGLATTEEIRNALKEFKESGKFVISYADAYTQRAYYMASVSDKIYINPEGIMEFSGLSASLTFFKRTLEKLGVEPQVIRHGRFKSAVEPYMLDKISPENKLQVETFLGTTWKHIITEIGISRSIAPELLQQYADQATIMSAEDAVRTGMVDGTRYIDQVISELKTMTDTTQTGDLESIDIFKYKNTPKTTDKLITEQPKIAVIYAQGEIGMGKGSNNEIGTKNISEALAKARNDKKVKAVVLRINSPGGSSLTSEIILREAQLTQKEKPLIVSMGDVAASGGYYIACAADTIVANRTTITGSIGVFGLLFNAEKLISDKLGVTVNTIKTAQYADMGTPTRKMTQAEREIITQQIVAVYKTFVNHVSRARNMTYDEVDKIGEGRVWTGADAKNIGLVDVFGGLAEAVRIAAEKANIDDYRIEELPIQKNTIQSIFEELETEVLTRIAGDNAVVAKYMSHISKALNMKGIQARMEYDIDIE